MFVTHMKISNFRNIQQTSATFSPQINYIIGKNGNGKSSILKAINFVFELKPIPKETRIEYIYKQQDNLTASVTLLLVLKTKEVCLFKETFPSITTINTEIQITRKLSLFDDELRLNGIKISLINLETLLLNNQILSPLFYFEQGSIMSSLTEFNDTERFELLKKSCSVFFVEKEIKKNIKILNNSKTAFAENSEILKSLELKVRKYRKLKMYKEEYDNLNLELQDVIFKLKNIELTNLENILKEKYENKDILLLKRHLNELEKDSEKYKHCEVKELCFIEKELENKKEKHKSLEEQTKESKIQISETEDIINELKCKLENLIIQQETNLIYAKLPKIANTEEHKKCLKELSELKKQPKCSSSKASIGFNSLIDKRKLLWSSIKDIKTQLRNEEVSLKRFKFSHKILDKKDVKIDFKYVYELIVVPKELEVAVAAILGNLLFAIVVRTEDEAHKIVANFKNVNVICEERICGERRSLIKGEEGLIRMSSLIQPAAMTAFSSLPKPKNGDIVDMFGQDIPTSQTTHIQGHSQTIDVKNNSQFGYADSASQTPSHPEVPQKQNQLIELLFKEYFLTPDLATGLSVLKKIENNEIPKSTLRNTTLRNLRIITISGERLRHGEIQTNFGNYKDTVFSPTELKNKQQNITNLQNTIKKNKEEIETITKQINFVPIQSLSGDLEIKIKISLLEKQLDDYNMSGIKRRNSGENTAVSAIATKSISLVESELADKKNKLELLKGFAEGLEVQINETAQDVVELTKKYEETKDKAELEKKIGEFKEKAGVSNKIDIFEQQNVLEKNKIKERARKLREELGSVCGKALSGSKSTPSGENKSFIADNSSHKENACTNNEDALKKETELKEKLEKLTEKTKEYSKKINPIELAKGTEVFESYEKFYRKNEELKQTSLELTGFIDKLTKHKEKVFKKFLTEFESNFKKMIGMLPFQVNFGVQIDENSHGATEIPGKFFISDLLSKSGGEKTLISLMFILALQITQPSSLYLFDEVEAALDTTNCKLFSLILKSVNDKKMVASQLFLITFNSELLSGVENCKIINVQEGVLTEVSEEVGKQFLEKKFN
ncbi:Chromosome partition protein Smc [Cucumispora dikerogammari]|nr:Chromosome partition protein Smc [Cucumispora dikerogammari]